MEKASEKLAAVYETLQHLEMATTRKNVDNMKLALDAIEVIYSEVQRLEENQKTEEAAEDVSD